jgi:hypothetical protein
MRVALIHDWLIGMRGGEKCLEVFCELFPDADLYTLVYDPDGVSPAIRRMHVKTSWIDRLPGAQRRFRYLLPLFPHAVEHFELSDYDLILVAIASPREYFRIGRFTLPTSTRRCAMFGICAMPILAAEHL